MHFLTITNNGKLIPRFDGHGMQLQYPDYFSFYQGTDKSKSIRFIETFKNPIYSKIILITPVII